MRTGILAGAAAGAAGTAALNAATYLDLAVRGRASNSTSGEQPGTEPEGEHRAAGLASLSGIVTGVGIGVTFGLLRRAGVRPPAPFGAALIGAATMASTNLSKAALDVTDPRTRSATGWLTDAIPHLLYGAVTDAVLRSLYR